MKMKKEEFSDLLLKWEGELSVKNLPPLGEDFIFAHAFLMAFLGNNDIVVSKVNGEEKFEMTSYSGKDSFSVQKCAKKLSFSRRNDEVYYKSSYDISTPNFVKGTSVWEGTPFGKKQIFTAKIAANEIDGVFSSTISEQEEGWTLDVAMHAKSPSVGDKSKAAYHFRKPEFEKIKISSGGIDVPFLCVRGTPTAVSVLEDCFGEESQEIEFSEFVSINAQGKKKFEDVERVKKLIIKKKQKEAERQRLEAARVAAGNLVRGKGKERNQLKIDN